MVECYVSSDTKINATSKINFKFILARISLLSDKVIVVVVSTVTVVEGNV